MSAQALRRQSGQAMVITALLITAMVAFVGLSIDGGRLYIERRALQNAADGAALAMADAYYGAVLNKANNNTPFATAFDAGKTQFQRATGITLTQNGGTIPTDCSVLPTSANYPPTPTTSTANVIPYTSGASYSVTLSVWESSVSGVGACSGSDGKSIHAPAFTVVASHNGISTALVQVLPGAPNHFGVTVAATAFTARAFTPPTLLVLAPFCGGSSQNALNFTGGGNFNISGDTFSNGNVIDTNNATFDSYGNVGAVCTVDPNVQFPTGGTATNGASPEDDPMTQPGGFVSKFGSSYYTSPYILPSPTDGLCGGAALNCVELEPGIYLSDTFKTNGTGSGECWFAEPGIYTWASPSNTGSLIFNDNGVLMSNELTAPDGAGAQNINFAAQPAGFPRPTFNWNSPQGLLGTPQSCLGQLKENPTTPGGSQLAQGTWYFRVTSVREERIWTSSGVNTYWRESNLSNACPETQGGNCTVDGVTVQKGCLVVTSKTGNTAAQVAISNIPGMMNGTGLNANDTTVASEYHIYGAHVASTSTNAATDALNCSTLPFGYVGKITNTNATYRQTEDHITKKGGGGGWNGCPFIPAAPWTANFSQNALSGLTPQCSLGYVASSVFGAGLSTAAPTGYCKPNAPVAPCQAPYLDPSFPPSTSFLPDSANEGECVDTTGAYCSPTPTAAVSGTTPGGVMYYFPSTTSCLKQSQGAAYLFGGLQWQGVSLYAQAPGTCGSNGASITGNNGGTYIGLVYIPTASLTVAGGGSPVDGAIIVWQITLTGGSQTFLTGIFPHVTQVAPGQLILCTSPGTTSTYCPPP